MNKSTSQLPQILETLTRAARILGLNDSAWAARAGLRKETLSRLRGRPSCDFATLCALAQAAGAKLGATSSDIPDSTPDGHFPLHVSRDYEERLLKLCASNTFEPEAWSALGPRFFMAGLAVMLASMRDFDRRELIALAETLHPGAGEPAVFARWLERSPIRPSRFLPMLEMELKHAA